jgi:hypothetical protein
VSRKHLSREIGDPKALGRRVARRFIKRGKRPEVKALAAQLGVSVVEQEAPPPAQPDLRSEYRPSPPRIILYRDPLDQLDAAVRVGQRFDMIRHKVEDVHIAHELFHHLQSGNRFGPLYPEEEEEAAHAFAQELLGLEFHPTEYAATE